MSVGVRKTQVGFLRWEEWGIHKGLVFSVATSGPSFQSLSSKAAVSTEGRISLYTIVHALVSQRQSVREGQRGGQRGGRCVYRQSVQLGQPCMLLSVSDCSCLYLSCPRKGKITEKIKLILEKIIVFRYPGLESNVERTVMVTLALSFNSLYLTLFLSLLGSHHPHCVLILQ